MHEMEHDALCEAHKMKGIDLTSLHDVCAKHNSSEHKETKWMPVGLLVGEKKDEYHVCCAPFDSKQVPRLMANWKSEWRDAGAKVFEKLTEYEAQFNRMVEKLNTQDPNHLKVVQCLMQLTDEEREQSCTRLLHRIAKTKKVLEHDIHTCYLSRQALDPGITLEQVRNEMILHGCDDLERFYNVVSNEFDVLLVELNEFIRGKLLYDPASGNTKQASKKPTRFQRGVGWVRRQMKTVGKFLQHFLAWLWDHKWRVFFILGTAVMPIALSLTGIAGLLAGSAGGSAAIAAVSQIGVSIQAADIAVQFCRLFRGFGFGLMMAAIISKLIQAATDPESVSDKIREAMEQSLAGRQVKELIMKINAVNTGAPTGNKESQAMEEAQTQEWLIGQYAQTANLSPEKIRQLQQAADITVAAGKTAVETVKTSAKLYGAFVEDLGGADDLARIKYGLKGLYWVITTMVFGSTWMAGGICKYLTKLLALVEHPVRGVIDLLVTAKDDVLDTVSLDPLVESYKKGKQMLQGTSVLQAKYAALSDDLQSKFHEQFAAIHGPDPANFGAGEEITFWGAAANPLYGTYRWLKSFGNMGSISLSPGSDAGITARSEAILKYSLDLKEYTVAQAEQQAGKAIQVTAEQINSIGGPTTVENSDAFAWARNLLELCRKFKRDWSTMSTSHGGVSKWLQINVWEDKDAREAVLYFVAVLLSGGYVVWMFITDRAKLNKQFKLRSKEDLLPSVIHGETEADSILPKMTKEWQARLSEEQQRNLGLQRKKRIAALARARPAG